MSLDTVDDLHAAEDRVGFLEHEIVKLADQVIALEHSAVLRTIPDVQKAISSAMGLKRQVAEGYCRPSCEDHDHDDPNDEEAADCGCPAHEEVPA